MTKKSKKSTKRRSVGRKKGPGRPTKYCRQYEEQARKLCKLGATVPDLADFFGVAVSTVNLWASRYPAFSDSLKAGREIADQAVEQSLFRRAIGYEHDAVKIMQHQGSAVIVPYVERYPPDTTACIFWLKNRKPEQWRDKKEVEGKITLEDLLSDGED